MQPAADGHRAGENVDYALFKHSCVDTLIKLPSAHLVDGGLAPLVINCHRAGNGSPPTEATAVSMETGEMRPKKKDLDGIQEGDEDDDE